MAKYTILHSRVGEYEEGAVVDGSELTNLGGSIGRLKAAGAIELKREYVEVTEDDETVSKVTILDTFPNAIQTGQLQTEPEDINKAIDAASQFSTENPAQGDGGKAAKNEGGSPFAGMTIATLRQIAREQDIEGASQMNKAQLLEVLNKTE